MGRTAPLQVTELGLQLDGIPHHTLVKAQEILIKYSDLPAGWVRDALRPLCGPAQDAAEAVAEATLAVHTHTLPQVRIWAACGVYNAGECEACGYPVPCPDVVRACLTLDELGPEDANAERT